MARVDETALRAHVEAKGERLRKRLPPPPPSPVEDLSPIVARATLTPGIFTVDGKAGLWAAGAVLVLALRDGRLVTVLDDTQPEDPAKE